MAELDKFKRRVIRTVARMMRHENRPEDEMWELLKKETGCDCKLLWERMRSLTLKKLKRLLIAEDMLENIIPVARMSLTDWLLFDLVLVHEDIDVIGDELGIKGDIKPLSDLLFLVEKLNIEGKQGEALAQAWTAATIAYNNNGRQCSPMLLQRRWYQMKKLSRAGFYKFWFNYRGNSRLLESCKELVPSKLKMDIAQRFPHIITRPFLEWEDLIKQRFVILPNEIEKNMKAVVPQSSSNNDNSDTDIICLEPNIETIDLSDVESESDNSNAAKVEASTENQVLNEVTVKTEPAEETGVYTKSLSELLEQRGKMLLESVPNIDDEDSNSYIAIGSMVATPVDNNNIDAVEENGVTQINSDKNVLEEIQISEIDTVKPNTEIDMNECEKAANEINVEECGDGHQDNVSVEVKSEYISRNKDYESMETDNELISEQMQINELIVMPQITSVFGNVNVTEQLSNSDSISMNVDVTEPPIAVLETADGDIPKESIEVVDDPVNEINEKMKVFLETKETEAEEPKSSDFNPVVPNIEKPLKDSPSNEPNPFLNFSVELTFADHGIELVEDDVEFEDDIIKPIKASDIKSENDSDSDKRVDKEMECDEENTKFDLKLLMQPVVYTTKLDDMIVFRNIEIDHVSGMKIIDNALSESKPINEMSQNIKEEEHEAEEVDETVNNSLITCNKINDSDGILSDDELRNTEESNIARVKLSSYLLQKPRSRSYNPIQLCKNPDFNTRLKRLTVGFLSSTRNRSFLKTLKPMTIDVSKTFEKKLINSTMYLQSDEVDKPVDIEEVAAQTTSVLPSAMSVQSLIDNAIVQNVFPPIKSNNSLSLKLLEGDSPFPERNKIINLPDIDHVRKMNQRLFTAEITPMRFQQPHEKCIPPVQLVSSHTELTSDRNDPIKSTKISTPEVQLTNQNCIGYKQTNDLDTTISNVVNKTRLIDPLPLKTKPGPKNGPPSKFKKPHYNYYTPCRSKPVHKAGWLTKGIKECNNDDALLTIDTLNKMLNLMKDTNLKPPNGNITAKKARRMLAKRQAELENRLEEFENTLKRQTSEDQASKADNPVEVDDKIKKTITKPNTSEEKDSVSVEPNTYSPLVDNKINKKKETSASNTSAAALVNTRQIVNSCCWARHKILFPCSRRRHNCPRLCTCCCRQELVDTRLRKKLVIVKNNVGVTIGCVAQESEELNVGSSTPLLAITPFEKQQKVTKSQAKTTTPLMEISIQCDLSNKTGDTLQNKIQVESKEVPPEIIEIDDNEDAVDDKKESVSQPVPCPSIETPIKRGRGRPRISVLSPALLASPPSSFVGVSNDTSTNTKLSSSYVTPKKPIVIRKQYAVSDKDNDKIKEKLIYLNNKQKTKIETGCPIFLGRNKILLTDEKIPSNLQPQPINIRPQQKEAPPLLAMPEGVQIILMPDGRVTYTVDPSVNISVDDLAALPTIVAAIQEQLALDSSNTNLEAPQNSTDVVNLIDDETLDEAAKTQSSIEGISNNTANLNNNSENSTVLDERENVNIDKSSDHGTLLESKNEKPGSDVSGDEALKSTEEISHSVEADGVTRSSNASIVTNESNPTPIENLEPINETALKPSVQVTESTGKTDGLNYVLEEGSKIITEGKDESTDNTRTTTNRSTLLSDLMQMSGISAEDTTPSENLDVSVPPLTPLPVSQSSPRFLQTAVNSTPVITTSPNNNLKELNSITSFAQLKYACENNGNFFKLDLDTGTITPISVCIKKNQSLTTKPIVNRSLRNNHPKSVIDLTDDPSEEYEPPAFIISKPTQSLLKDSFHLPNSAKPVKIFKSIHISNRKQKKDTNEALTDTAQDVIPKTASHKKQRKQSFNASLILDDSFDSVDEYIWNHNTDSLSDDESSDDEPLAMKAKRMRTNDQTEEASGVTNIENIQTNVGQGIVNENVKHSADTPIVINNEITEGINNDNDKCNEENNDENKENNDANDENNEDSEVFREITFLSDHDDDGSDDNCILGV